MKQKLLNSFKLRVCLLVAVLCAGFTGQAWGDVTDVLTASELAATSNSYTDFSNVIITSDAVYAGQSAKTSSGGIQLRSKNSNSGIVTTTSGGKVKSVTIAVESGSNTIDVYGKNSAYSSASDLYSSSTQGTKLGSLSADGTVTVTGDYEYVGIRSNNGAVYLSSVEITWETTGGSSSAVATTTTIDDSGITNTDVYEGTTAGSLSASVTAGGNAVAGATVTWRGNNDNVATINESTGAVTLVAAGTVTFTASYEGVENSYNASSATYTLNVTDSTPFAGGDVTFTAGIETSETNTLTKNGVTLTGSTFSNASYYQAFKNSTFTIETSTGTITQIVFTCTGSSYKASGFGDAITANGNNGTWTGNASKVELTASGNQVRMSQIVVTVDANGAPTPTITASDVNIAHDAISGSITCTLTNEVIGGVVSATSSESWLTIGTISGTTVPLTCTANVDNTARTATVTLTYTYNTNETVTTDVTVTQAAAPVIYSTIPALFAAATGTETSVLVTFNNWVVSGVSTNGKNVFVTDNRGNGFVIYYSSDMSGTFAAGDILSGTAVSCTLKKYNGFAELLNVDANDLTISTGGTVTAANVAMADLAGVNTGALVHYDNLTCSVDNSKYYLSDGTTTLQVYNALYAFGALEAGKTYNITGVYQQYGNSTKEILPRSDADIEEVQVQHNDYNLTVTLSDHISAIFVFDTADDTNPLILDGAAGTVQVTDGTQIMVSPDADAGYQLATLTVDGNDVTSYIVSNAYTFIMPTHAVTITATAEAIPVTPTDNGAAVTYDFTSTDNFLTSYPGETHPGTSSSNAVSTFYYSNGDEFTASGTNHYFNEGYFMLGKSGATLTLPAFPFNVSKISVTGTSAASEKVEQNIYVGDDAVSTETTGAKNVTNDYAIATASQAAGTIYKLKVTSAHNTQISKIEVFGYEPVTVTSVGYGTYASDNALDFTGSSIKAFYATVSGSTMTFHSVSKVPANTGVLLYKAGGATENVPVFSGTADDVTGNVFVRGTDASVTWADNDQKYVLFKGEDGIGFYKANNNPIATNRAYIQVPTGTNVKSFSINLDDTDAIKAIAGESENAVIYNLAGQRVNKAQKGIYIINGKKVLVK